MTVIIRYVQNKSDFKKFVQFPFSLYRKNPYWVPLLKKEIFSTLNQNINPAFETCDAELWLAYKSGRIAGRIAGIINHRHNDYTGRKQARFILSMIRTCQRNYLKPLSNGQKIMALSHCTAPSVSMISTRRVCW